MLRSKVMLPMFRLPFLFFFFFIVEIFPHRLCNYDYFHLMHFLSFIGEICTIVITCVFAFAYVMLCYLR